jgi:DNA ligase (NAD+)
VVLSDKLDGISALLYLKKGQWNLYTRGDGTDGQNISHILPHLRKLPNLSKLAEAHSEFAVRAELILSKSTWDAMSNAGSNPRNVVAGAVNAKTFDIGILKQIDFVAYECMAPVHGTMEDQLTFLEQEGFKVAHHRVVDVADLSDELLRNYLQKRKEKSKYVIDGVVVFHNGEHKRAISKNPKYAFAYKSSVLLQRATVVVSKVEWNVSKDKYLKPLVYFSPVNIDGVVISKATGFNAKYIHDNVIGPGSQIVIVRSGDVIPYIVEILTKSKSGEPDFPDDIAYNWNESGVDIMVDMDEAAENSDVIESIVLKELTYFFKTLDIKGVAAGTVKKLYDCGMTTVKKILQAKEADLIKCDGIQAKGASNIVGGLQKALAELTPLKLMKASNKLGRGLGERKVGPILEAIPKIIAKRYIPTVEELIKVEGIEKKLAQTFIDNLPEFWQFVDNNGLSFVFGAKHREKLEEAKEAEVATDDGPKLHNVKDMAIVFTGFRDAELEKRIVRDGGRVASTISKKVNIVVAKDEEHKSSSKVTKAEEMGITIMTKDEFVKWAMKKPKKGGDE